MAGQPGTEPEIVVEVRAMNQEGFDDATVRNVSENAGALKFDHREFGGRVVASRHRGVAALLS